MDLRNLLTVAEAVAWAGLERRESRGAHFRDDHPQKDAELGKVMQVISKGRDGEMCLRQERLPEMPEDLGRIIAENE